MIGSREKLEAFIKKLSNEGGTGEIYKMQQKKKNQKARKTVDFIPRKSIVKESAYE